MLLLLRSPIGGWTVEPPPPGSWTKNADPPSGWTIELLPTNRLS